MSNKNNMVQYNNLNLQYKNPRQYSRPIIDTIPEINNVINQESRTTTEEEILLGETTTLTASFYDDTYTPISTGKAIFKVNGKTLRDDEGNVIYADVVNGRVELPDVNITSEWTKEGTTIQAVYCGNEDNAPIFAEETLVNITKPEATVTITAPETATAGEEIKLTATITDGDKNINTGRVVFKLNGKTLKDKDGKALYIDVENGVASTTYTIPAKTKVKSYTLTAVYMDNTYDCVEDVAELVVTKA